MKVLSSRQASMRNGVGLRKRRDSNSVSFFFVYLFMCVCMHVCEYVGVWEAGRTGKRLRNAAKHPPFHYMYKDKCLNNMCDFFFFQKKHRNTFDGRIWSSSGVHRHTSSRSFMPSRLRKALEMPPFRNMNYCITVKSPTRYI